MISRPRPQPDLDAPGIAGLAFGDFILQVAGAEFEPARNQVETIQKQLVILDDLLKKDFPVEANRRRQLLQLIGEAGLEQEIAFRTSGKRNLPFDETWADEERPSINMSINNRLSPLNQHPAVPTFCSILATGEPSLMPPQLVSALLAARFGLRLGVAALGGDSDNRLMKVRTTPDFAPLAAVNEMMANEAKTYLDARRAGNLPALATIYMEKAFAFLGQATMQAMSHEATKSGIFLLSGKLQAYRDKLLRDAMDARKAAVTQPTANHA